MADGAELLLVRPPGDSLNLVTFGGCPDRLVRCIQRGFGSAGCANDPQEEVDSLLELFEEGLPPGNVLVATADTLDQRSRLFKWFKANDAVTDCRLEKDRSGHLLDTAVAEFVAARLRGNGVKSPKRNLVNAITERAGADIGELAREIDKLCLAAVSGAPDENLVADQMRDLGEVWVFALTDALSARRLDRAQLLLEQLMRQGEPALKLIAVLGTHFAQLARSPSRAASLASGGSAQHGTGQASI